MLILLLIEMQNLVFQGIKKNVCNPYDPSLDYENLNISFSNYKNFPNHVKSVTQNKEIYSIILVILDY